MSITSILLLILGLIYGILSILAGIIQFTKKTTGLFSNSLMIIGGILVAIVAAFSSHLKLPLLFLILGLMLIHISAILNGKKLYGKIHLNHHIIRLIFSIILIVLFIFK